MPKEIDVNIIQEKLEDLLKNHSQLEFDFEMQINDAIEFQIQPHFSRQISDFYESAARELKLAITEAVIHFVDTLPEVKLSFDQNGVNKLLEMLSKEQYKFRNYTFVDDWAIREEVRKTPQYCELVKKINDIPFVNVGKEIGYLFLKNGLFKINVRVLSYGCKEPTVEQCDKYLEGYKITDGKYKLDYAVYTKQEAQVWVKDNIRIESSVFKVATTINPDSGFRIGLLRQY